MELYKFANRIKYGCNIRKPLYMFRLFRNLYVRYLLDGRPLRGIDFAIDYACNLKCKHCFNKDILDGKRKMTFEDYSRVFSEAESEGILNFCFQGGEFLIMKNWEDYLRLLNPHKFSISITSNGTCIGMDTVNRMKSLGVNTLTVSLDSGLAEEHDDFRGLSGSHQKAIQGIEYALRAGIKVVVNCTITPESLHSTGFKVLLEYTRQHNILVNTIFAAPSGEWQGCQNIVMTDSDIAFYKSIVKKYGNIVRDVDSLYKGRGCPAVNESLYITPYGDVFGCAYIHLKLGNVFDESLHEIRKKGFDFFKYQARCLISENQEFIREYDELVKGKKLPLDYENHKKIKHWF